MQDAMLQAGRDRSEVGMKGEFFRMYSYLMMKARINKKLKIYGAMILKNAC